MAARATLLPLDEAQDLAAIFSVLADPTRVRIVQVLAERELCVCDLANLVGMRQSTVSHQLRLLRALRIVRFRKEGRVAYYMLDDAHIGALLTQGLEHVREAGSAAGQGRDEQAGAA
jgi:DNA-binding transcriptional ArsR family regulator